MHKPLVSVLIVNWNGEKYLNTCVGSIVNQKYSNLEIIVVDNASTDNSINILKKEFPFVKIIQNYENLGFAAANNIGIKNAKGELIALFNYDAIADPEWLGTLVEVLQNSRKIAAVAGKVYYWGDKYGKDAVFCTWSKIDPYSCNLYNFNDNEPMSKVDYLTGAAMIVKKQVIENIGLMDSEYFLYFDETDWCARMLRAGYDLIYFPDAMVWHMVSGSVADAKLKLYYMTRNRIRFVLKNFDWKYISLFAWLYMIETIYVFIQGMKHHDLREIKVRIKAISWNILHLRKTLKARRRDTDMIKKTKGRVLSFNKSLPLREYKKGRIEQYLRMMGI